MNNQEIKVTTFVKLDIIDSIKCLFGRCLKIETKIELPYDEQILSYNAMSNTSIERTSSHFVKQDKPNFGYTEKEN